MRPRGIVRVCPSTGGEPRELLQIDKAEENTGLAKFLSWTPDGEYLLFGKRDSELWRVHVESGEQERIGGTIQGLSYAAMHPDGRRIAFTSVERGSELWVMENFLP